MVGGTMVLSNRANLQSYALGRMIWANARQDALHYRYPRRLKRDEFEDDPTMPVPDAAFLLAWLHWADESPYAEYYKRIAAPDGDWFMDVQRHIAKRDGHIEPEPGHCHGNRVWQVGPRRARLAA